MLFCPGVIATTTRYDSDICVLTVAGPDARYRPNRGRLLTMAGAQRTAREREKTTDETALRDAVTQSLERLMIDRRRPSYTGRTETRHKPNDRWGEWGTRVACTSVAERWCYWPFNAMQGVPLVRRSGQASASCGSIGVDGVWVCVSSVQQLRTRPLWRGVPTWRKRCTTPSLRTERRRRSCVRAIYLQRNTANRRPVFVFSVASSPSSSSWPTYLLGPRTALIIIIIIYKHTVVVIIAIIL